MKAGRLFLVGFIVLSASGTTRVADAHGGGLDSTGGHHCRQAGYDSGKCAPLDSYHCHQSPCGAAAPTTTAAPPTTAARVTTTSSRPPTTTTSSRPPTTTTAAPTTTTAAPTTTTQPPTTTTSTTTTTTAPSTTTTATVLSDADPAVSEKEPDDGNPVVGAIGLALIGGLGFAGYRAVKRRSRRATDAA